MKHLSKTPLLSTYKRRLSPFTFLQNIKAKSTHLSITPRLRP
jgi:hypothetical protein